MKANAIPENVAGAWMKEKLKYERKLKSAKWRAKRHWRRKQMERKRKKRRLTPRRLLLQLLEVVVLPDAEHQVKLLLENHLD